MDVRLIAHRGYAIHAPQNSAEAFEAAGRLGFWAIETDVRRTLDGVLVCCHDATVDSMFCGSGEISALPWDALRSLTFREDKKNGSLRMEGMPLFHTYLSICKAHGALPFIELKTMDTEAVLAEARQFFDDGELVISSSRMEHLRLARRLSPAVFLHHIFSDESSIRELAGMGPAGCSLNQPDLNAFDPTWVGRVHAHGLQLCLRAGDTPDAVRRMVALGLDYVPTNCVYPALV